MYLKYLSGQWLRYFPISSYFAGIIQIKLE